MPAEKSFRWRFWPSVSARILPSDHGEANRKAGISLESDSDASDDEDEDLESGGPPGRPESRSRLTRALLRVLGFLLRSYPALFMSATFIMNSVRVLIAMTDGLTHKHPWPSSRHRKEPWTLLVIIEIWFGVAALFQIVMAYNFRSGDLQRCERKRGGKERIHLKSESCFHINSILPL